MRIVFGELKIGDIAKEYIRMAVDKNWVSEGANVKEFEQKFDEIVNFSGVERVH